MRFDRISTLFKSLGMSKLFCPSSPLPDFVRLSGCKVNKLTQSDLKRLGLPDAAGEVKRAVLKTPLEFPKARTRRRK
jgi:hypothetical protein